MGHSPRDNQRRANRDRENYVEPDQRLQIAAQVAAKNRAAKNAHRLKYQRLINQRQHDVDSERYGISTVLIWHEPTPQQDADHEVRTRNERLIQNRQTAFASPGNEFLHRRASVRRRGGWVGWRKPISRRTASIFHKNGFLAGF